MVRTSRLPRRLALAAALAMLHGTAPAEVLSLHTAWQKAVISEPAWRIAQAEADADKEDANKARAGLLPQIGISSSNSRNSLSQAGASTLNYDASSASLTLRQPLFRLQSFAELQRASARGEAAEFRLANESQALAVRVAQAYFEVLQAEDAIRYASYLEKSLTTQVDAARKSLRAGAGTRIDIDEARARLAIAAADRVAAENGSANAKKRLAAIVGTPVTGLIPLDEERAKALRLTPASFTEWLEIARSNSPELAAAGKSVEESSHAVTTARAGHLPTVDLVMSRARSESDSVSTINSRYHTSSVGVQVNVPLFSGGYTTADTAQATARYQRAMASRDHTDRQIETRLLQEFNGVQQGEERLASLAVALDSSEEALRSTRLGVAAGSRTSLDVLNAERQLYSTQLDKSRARYEWLMSRMRLQALAGKLGENEIKEVSSLLSLAAASRPVDSVVIRPVAAPVQEPIPRDSTATRRAAQAAADKAAATATEVVAPADAATAPAAAPTIKPDTESPPQATADSVAAEPAKVAVASEAPPPQHEKPGATEAMVEPAKAEVAAAKPSVAPIIAPQGKGKYAVALGTFGNPDNVVRMLAAAEKLNITTYTETTAKGLTRVRAGPFASKAEARKVLRALKAAGMAGVLDKR